MPIDYSTQVYLHAFNTFARTITVIPLASQPGELPYTARGIYNSDAVDVVAEDGSIISDQRTIIDVREEEFTYLPLQGDQIIIPGDGGIPEAGTFEIIDSISNGGGESTLTLRKVMQSAPVQAPV